MCILIVKKAGASIDDKSLNNGFDNNPDGWGFAYVSQGEGKIVVEKSLTSFKHFLSVFRSAEERNPDSHFIIHFRIATSGGVKKVNCHPFVLNENIVYAHNGVLSINKKELIKDENDTRAFGRLILEPLYNKDNQFYYDPTFDRLITAFLENRNKIALLDINNNVKIYNEGLGDWINGVWYSNASWKYGKTKSVSTPFYTGTRNQVFNTPAPSKFYDDATCTIKGGILLLDYKVVAPTIRKIIKTDKVGLTKVVRLFKVHTPKERVDGIIKFWDDETEGWYSKEEIDDLILIKYLSGKECFCPTCIQMLGEEEIKSDRDSVTKCGYCQTNTVTVIDDMVAQ